MNYRILGACLALLLLAALPVTALAASAAEIDAEVRETLVKFNEEVNGAEVFLNNAAGYLVFPRVIKVGIGIGGETGEGALLVNGQSVDYFRTSAGSFGLQLGAQAKSIVIVFMTSAALDKFSQQLGLESGCRWLGGIN